MEPRGKNSAVRIRPLTLEDLRQLERWEQDPEITALVGQKMAAWGGSERWWADLKGDPYRIGFAIELDGRLVGDVELEHISWRSGEAEVRICLGDKRCWGQGHGRAALAHLLRYAFCDLGLGSVYLRVWQHNHRAIHLYQKMGFRKAGRLPATGRLSGGAELWLMELSASRFLQGAATANDSAARAPRSSTALG